MLGFIDSLWVFISAIFAISILGFIAGFSPTLYVTQVGIAAKAKSARSLMIALMLGVLLGIITLSILFQSFQPDTLRAFIDSTTNALFVSVVFNVIIGAVFIAAGFWYINKKPNRISKDDKSAAKSSYWALVSFGFFRTFASISGATATFFASGIITDAKVGVISWILLTGLFLAATITPFVLIMTTMERHPKKIISILEWFRIKLLKYNYKLVIGVVSILLGSAIIMFNLLKAIAF